jgi:hypothetical protein
MKKEKIKLYKVLKNTIAKDGGSFDYKNYLPKNNKIGSWLPKIVIKKEDICSKGYHLTKNYHNWVNNGNVVFECEPKNVIEWSDDKCVCDSFRFIKKIKTNTGLDNTGLSNSGDSNSGNSNSGDYNSGYYNSGDYNSGYRNSGYRNSGNCNSGYHNSGYHNSGNSNSGDCNSGNYNSGDYNSGNYNSGFFNTNIPKLRMFNKLTNKTREEIKIPLWLNINLNVWVNVENMSDEEKQQFWWYKTTKGFLRTTSFKECFKINFLKTSLEELKETLKLPNFDYKIFEEITGITKKMFVERIKKLKNRGCI